MKGLIVYRILGFVVNMFCFLIALQLLMALPFVFSNAAFLLPLFLMVAVILYAWFANVYYKKIYVQKLTVTKKLKDLVQVNAIVTLIFCALLLVEIIAIYQNPQLFLDAIKNFAQNYPVTLQTVKQSMTIFGVFAAIMLAHVVWTLTLIRRNRHLVES